MYHTIPFSSFGAIASALFPALLSLSEDIIELVPLTYLDVLFYALLELDANLSGSDGCPEIKF